MIPKSKKSKLELIEANHFKDLPEETRVLFVKRSVMSAPGFAFELSKFNSPASVFKEVYDRSSHRYVSAFENAIKHGHLALARLWLLKFNKLEGGRHRESWMDIVKITHVSSATDAQIYRARVWLQKSFNKKETPEEVMEEVMSAFCNGRPLLGFLCAKELLKYESSILARLTLSGKNWPKEMRVDDAGNFKKVLFSLQKSIQQANKVDIKECGLLSHIRYWAEALKGSSPELAEKLKNLGETLWDLGAFDGPKVHAKLFRLKPYTAEDPRAKIVESASAIYNGDKESFYSTECNASEVFKEMLLEVCRNPGSLEDPDDGRNWDHFIAAHPQCKQANSNPFTKWGLSSCALLSLTKEGGGRLIELGLSRGYSIKDSEWVLAANDAMGRAFISGHLGELKYERLTNKTWTLTLENFLVPTENVNKKAIEFEGSKKILKSEKDWRYQSLSSVALSIGLHQTAMSLFKAGCSLGNYTQVLKEVEPRYRQGIVALEAKVQHEALCEDLNEDKKWLDFKTKKMRL